MTPTSSMPEAIGPYQIVEPVGAGGMAAVYKAYHARLDRHVALKFMHLSYLQDPNFRARFEREARIVARLEHPNIVPVYDFDEHNGQPYLVMKFVEGHTLKDLLKAGDQPTERLVAIVQKIAAALTYAHQQGILHRDVKPSNIIIDSRGEAHLTDFGLARIAQAGESSMSADMMLGTPQYISPEQARGETDLDARTDVYSLGIILYEILVGRVPYRGDSTYAIVHDHIYAPLPMPRQLNPEITPEVEHVLLRALAKEPGDRYDTPTAMMQAYTLAASSPQRNRAPQPDRPQAGRPPEHFPPPGPHRHPVIPRGPKPPPPPNPFPGLRELGRELGEVGREIKRELRGATKEARREMRKALRDVGPEGLGRYQWKPGARWMKDAYGNFGFFTEEEIEAQFGQLPTEEAVRRRVERRLKERGEFYTHLMSYVVVNTFLWLIWFAWMFGEHPWPIWVMLPWGFGLLMHYLSYRENYGAGREKREAMIQREIERERERLYGYSESKNKRELYAGDENVRLSGDGEFTDSFIDEIEERGKPKNDQQR